MIALPPGTKVFLACQAIVASVGISPQTYVAAQLTGRDRERGKPSMTA